MAAEAIALPPHFIDQIDQSLEASRVIQGIIVNTRASIQNLGLDACMEINQRMLMEICLPMQALKAPEVNFRRLGGRDGIPQEIQTEIGRILGSYSTIDVQLERLNENDMITTTDEIYTIYAESLHLLTGMEMQLQNFYNRITGQGIIGGYRKRKQRTKCKQHKQKHYKTYRKRKTHRRRK